MGDYNMKKIFVLLMGFLFLISLMVGVSAVNPEGQPFQDLQDQVNQKQNRVNGVCAVGESIRVINEDGTVVCETDDTGSGADDDWTTLGNDIFRLLGNVGIGTNSPVEKLEVNGNIRTNGVYAANVLDLVGGSPGATLARGGSIALKKGNHHYPGGDVVIQGGGSSDYYGHMDGGAKITLGGWNYPGNSNILLNIGGGIGGVGSTPNFLYINDVNGNPLMTVVDTGNVGIGTTSPTAKLHVAGEAKVTGVSGDGTGKVVCVKSDGDLGTCSSGVSETGTCDCT